jgi:ABC-type lipopolysaccharide export system ATPase subunit
VTDPDFILLDEPFAGLIDCGLETRRSSPSSETADRVITDHNTEDLGVCDIYLLIRRILEHGDPKL